MPIRPENRKRYPKDWKAISAAIRERAGNRCEGSPDFPECRAENGQAHPETGSRVVLTVAHLDHTPENCEPENLKAMCQRCHLNYDKEHHARTAYRTRMDKAGVEDMFGFPSNATITSGASFSRRHNASSITNFPVQAGNPSPAELSILRSAGALKNASRNRRGQARDGLNFPWRPI